MSLTIDELIERLNEIKSNYGNIEVKRGSEDFTEGIDIEWFSVYEELSSTNKTIKWVIIEPY